MNRLSPNRPNAAFTLVELLVVIGIIVVLMSLLLTAVPAVKEAQRKLDAQQTSSQIVAAVNAYYTEYAKFPPVDSAPAGGPAAAVEADTVVGDQEMNATVSNNALFNTLRNVPKGPNSNYLLNPRRVVFYEGKSAIVSGAGKPRQGFFDRTANGANPPEQEAGALFDPWGMQFGVILDTTSDERIDLDGYYTDFSGDDPSTGKAPRKRAGAFSMGKDSKLGNNGDRTFKKGSQRSDDVVSWE
jgi:prepilin-type N-terminal cleavage/methylation domain-containing protein